MKVLFTFLTFGKNIFAGMENSLYQLCQGLVENGDEPIVFTSFSYGTRKKVDGIRVFRSKHLPIDYSGGDSALRKRIIANKEAIRTDLLEILKKHQPEFIIAWDPLWGFAQYLDLPKMVNIPLILSFRVLNVKKTLLDAEKANYAKYFALSSFLKTEIIKTGFSNNIEVLNNSIQYEFIINQSKGQKRKKAILCNARLSPEKGIIYAIKAFNEVVKKYPNFSLWLCAGNFPFGDVTKEKFKIDLLIKKLKLEQNVRFLPNLEWKKIPKIIAQAYITVLPSLEETFGRSALESLAVGTPIIATNIGNLPALIESNGILVEPKSVQQLSSSLFRLIDDNAYYNSFVNKGRKSAKKFDRRIIAKQFINSLKHIKQ